MSLKFLNEGFELSQFNVLQENVVNQITSILNTLNEATMSDEDRRDSKLLRQILSKASDASYDKRRALKWTPQELEIADKYNLTLPQRTTNWDGSKEITPLKDNDVDYVRGFGRNKQVSTLQRDIGQTTGMYYRTDANMADFIRKRKEKGPVQDRPYRQADKYARVDDVSTFGDTTFTHDNSGRFGQSRWDKEKNRPATLAGGPRDSDLTDVEKDRVAVNKQMSQPVRDMKAALADRKANQKDLDNVNLNYARNVADARRRFDDAMAYADEQRQKESERGQQGVADANSRINKLLKKESFIRALEEKLNSLNEAEMSDEDKHDSEILKQIYQKTQSRANAALTQEEKDVLKKYNLERVPYIKNIRSSEGPYRNSIFDDKEFEGSYKWSTGKELPPKSDKINYADRARKRPERDAQKFDMRDRDFWDIPTPDYESNHKIEDGKYRPKTYQQRQRYSDNQKMTQNVRDMTRALRDRKESQKKLDSADSVYQAEIDKLKKDYEDRLARAQRSQKYRTDSDRRNLDYANQRINSLLKKEDYNLMNKAVISEAFDALHEYNNKSKKKNIIKENTSVNKRVVTRRNPYKRLVESYKDFDSYYDAAWEMFMDRVEYVDDAIEGGRGTTYIRFPGDRDVYKIDEEEAVDELYDLFNEGEDVSKAVECIGSLAEISLGFNESFRKKAKKKNIMESPMSPEDKRDTELFRSIEKKYYDAQQGNDTRKIKYTPAEQDFARRYNLTLPQRVGRSKYKVSPIWDNEDPSSETVLDKGLTTDVAISNLSSVEDKLLGNDRERPQDMGKVNMADYIRKRRERGRPVDRQTRAVGYDWHRNEISGDGSEYPHGPTSIDYLLTSNDDEDIFGDTTFVHDNKARFSSDDGKMMDDAKFTPQERARIHQNAGIRKQRQQAIDDLKQKQGVKMLRRT